MARVGQRANYNNLSNGVVSDANPVSPPENAARILQNVDVNVNGVVGRRLGLAAEEDFNFPYTVGSPTAWLPGYTIDELQDLAIDRFIWAEPGNAVDTKYLVVRVGNTVHIYDEGAAPLSGGLVHTLDISSFVVSTSTPDIAATTAIQMASGKGLLVCTGLRYQPFYITYESDSNTWSAGSITIKIRDFKGVDDGLAVDERPTSPLTDTHKYNLYNQGWPTYDFRDTYGLMVFPHVHFYRQSFLIFSHTNGATAWYPSNSDIWYLGVTQDGLLLKYSAPEAYSQYTAGTPAPKGHFIIDPFVSTSRQTTANAEIDRNAGNVPSAKVALTPDVVPTRRPAAVAFFAGRFWYASVDGDVFFTKIIESVNDLGVCYQEQDPTAEAANELLDTDGGVLPILGLGEVLCATPIAGALVLFGTGGVWAISGSEGGFTANSHKVDVLSRTVLTNYRAVVPTEESIYFWADDGINRIAVNQYGTLAVESISEDRIQTDYNAIPATAKAFAQGCYDPSTRRIYWAFSYYTTDGSVDILQKYTDVLVYNIPMGSFWTYKLSNEGYTVDGANYPYVPMVFMSSSRTSVTTEEIVTTPGGALLIAYNPLTGSVNTHVAESSNGMLWSAVDTGISTGNWDQVIYDPAFGFIVYATTPAIYYSSDGTTFTDTGDDLENPGHNLGGLSYDPARQLFALAGTSKLAYTTYDSIGDWSPDPFPAAGYTPSIQVDGFYNDDHNEFVAAGYLSGVNAYIRVSADGTSWASYAIGATQRFGNKPIVWIPAPHERYVAAVTNQSTTNAIYTADLPNGTWTLRHSPAYINLWAVDYSPLLDRVIACGNGSDLYYSDDGGLTWSTQSASGLTGKVCSLLWHTSWNLWIAGNDVGAVFYSEDGLSWTAATDDFTQSVEISDIVQVTEDQQVTDENGDPVTIDVLSSQFGVPALKLAMFVPDNDGYYRMTFGEFSSRTFLDWENLISTVSTPIGFPMADHTAGDYRSIVQTLPYTLGDPGLNKASTYLHTYYDYSRNGFNALSVSAELDGAADYKPGASALDLSVEHGVLVTAKWGWTTRSGSNRWTNPQQGIKPMRMFVPDDPTDPFNDGHGVRTSRLKIRGSGRSLVINFESETGKDFQLLGWTIPFTAKDDE